MSVFSVWGADPVHKSSLGSDELHQLHTIPMSALRLVLMIQITARIDDVFDGACTSIPSYTSHLIYVGQGDQQEAYNWVH